MIPVLQHLSPSHQDTILNLRRTSGRSGCPVPYVLATDIETTDNESHLTAPAVRWLAAGYFAEDLTGFVQAYGLSSDGYVETTLFVDAQWRRRGFATLLLKAAMDWASLRRAKAVRLVFARTDWPMRHLAEKFDARLDLMLGQMVADIPLGQPSEYQGRAALVCQQRQL
jgi:GNAT superfamily N-acetyltransferase